VKLPAVTSEVEIEDRSGGQVHAWVTAHVDGGMIVEWATAGRALPGECIARWRSARGVYALPCTVRADDTHGHLTAAGELSHVQRRGAVRVAIILPVRRTGPGAGPDEQGFTHNISATGMLVGAPLQLRMHQSAPMRIEMPGGGEPLDIVGEVRREAGPDILGIHFVGLEVAQEERLINLIFAQQRQALRSTRGS
jgi:PilZ domain